MGRSLDGYDAPTGAIWVCGACGRVSKNRASVGDESCFLNAVLCHDDKPYGVSSREWGWTAFPVEAGA